MEQPWERRVRIRGVRRERAVDGTTLSWFQGAGWSRLSVAALVAMGSAGLGLGPLALGGPIGTFLLREHQILLAGLVGGLFLALMGLGLVGAVLSLVLATRQTKDWVRIEGRRVVTRDGRSIALDGPAEVLMLWAGEKLTLRRWKLRRGGDVDLFQTRVAVRVGERILPVTRPLAAWRAQGIAMLVERELPAGGGGELDVDALRELEQMRDARAVELR